MSWICSSDLEAIGIRLISTTSSPSNRSPEAWVRLPAKMWEMTHPYRPLLPGISPCTRRNPKASDDGKIAIKIRKKGPFLQLCTYLTEMDCVRQLYCSVIGWLFSTAICEVVMVYQNLAFREICLPVFRLFLRYVGIFITLEKFHNLTWTFGP